MKKIKVKKDMSSVLSAVVIFILAILCFSFLATFTDNFTAPLKDFYVVCGNDDIMNDRENFDIVKGKEYKFEVVNTLGDGMDDYIVSIVPNQSAVAAFTFKTSLLTKVNYQDIENLGKGFTLIPYDGYFTLTATKDLSEILQLYYPSKRLSDVPTALDSDVPYFRLVVKVSGSTQVLNINFSLVSE
jgi:hypothetical protein